MKAEIIAVGSELLTPDRMDTNSLFLTEELNKGLISEKTFRVFSGSSRMRRLSTTLLTSDVADSN